ncbi:MAG: tyrosine-type recombinase/integrase [Planctomycetes bacterium]|nr:tyrosine-type recombinase/integrase [Planctomycetota bacterium]
MKKRHYCPTCGSPVLFPMELCQDLEAEAANWFEFLEAEEKSYGYMRKLRQRMRDYVLPEFSHRDVTKLQAKDVRMFYKKLRVRKLATRTIKHIMDTLRLFLCFLSDEGIINDVPRFPRIKQKAARVKRWINEDAQGRIIAAIPGEHQLIFRVLCETGARPSECRAFKVKDLEDGGIWISRTFDERGQVKETKTGTETYMPLSHDLYVELRAQSKRKFPNTWLFINERVRKPYNRMSFYHIWRKAAKAEGLTITPVQASRHSKASQKAKELRQEMNDKLRLELGHMDAGTTLKHYALPERQEIG